MANNGVQRSAFSGIGKVYSFSLKQAIATKGWLLSTLILGLLLLVGIPGALFIASSASEDSASKDDTEKNIRLVCVADETEGEADYSALNQISEEEQYEFKNCASMDAAIQESVGARDAVILRVTKQDGAYSLTVYLPQNTDISRSRASSFGTFVEQSFKAILLQKAEITAEGAALLSMPVNMGTASVNENAEVESNDINSAKYMINVMMPYFMMMLIYMMVVLYGQSMANSVMLEKTSKLMETILVTVHPFALLMGKLLAVATAAVLQILIWLGALICGLFGGTSVLLKLVPQSADNQVIASVQQITDLNTGIFSLKGAVIAVGFLALGFLLYLSLSALSGAVASKQEDLNKTNMIFSLILVGSLLLTMSSGMLDNMSEGQLPESPLWLKLIPFTAILVMPGRLLLGEESELSAAASAGVLLLSVILLIMLATVVYKLLVLYRGELLKPKQIAAMLKETRKPKSDGQTKA
ncbi:MAG: ABC transporter permease [Oscillospiraceae bacterium]|nr:ABC transporter permease [Oscillospiraceae bacterium]